jgi:biofilm PGA synthesis lipoprotein PgaB
MPGTCRASLALLLVAAILPAAGPLATRRHEVQFRRNDYRAVPAPSRLAAVGVGKAILRVFSDDERSGGLYFATGRFPVVRAALEAWAGAYAGGPPSLWAWMGARKFAWLRERGLLDREWDGSGFRAVPKLDLFHPGAVDLIASLFADLARQEVSGILIQDDLTLLRREGFSAWGRAAFIRASGLNDDPRLMLAPGTEQQRAWEAVKVACVGEALRRIVGACRAARPGIVVGLNVHYEAPLTPERARSWYAFDAHSAAAAGIDLFYLMAYHRQMRAEMRLGEGESRLYFRRMLEAALRLWGDRLVAKLQVRDWKSSEPIPLEELRAYYDLIPAAVGRVCFAAADPEDLELISRIITR